MADWQPIETGLLIAATAMLYIIGYSLTMVGTIVLSKRHGDATPRTDFLVALLWPLVVPIIWARVVLDREPPTP